ncbi:hypothetical protein RF11_15978 [Thelohanellus kitauei]|uniref:Uncharacterized protein n=1 Tax=Thelohanellus kitauei TaxID=669202 RepID=A0A0C2IM74_THEKT|nr:hypothetical protein RF11_15978 [Thelohanellus kitauei]
MDNRKLLHTLSYVEIDLTYGLLFCLTEITKHDFGQFYMQNFSYDATTRILLNLPPIYHKESSIRFPFQKEDNAIASLKSNKAIGFDRIIPKFIKYLCPASKTVDLLLLMYNL